MEHTYWLDPVIMVIFENRLSVAAILTTIAFFILYIESFQRRGH